MSQSTKAYEWLREKDRVYNVYNSIYIQALKGRNRQKSLEGLGNSDSRAVSERVSQDRIRLICGVLQAFTQARQVGSKYRYGTLA